MPINLTDLNLEVHTLLSQIITETIPSHETDLIETGLLGSLSLVSLLMELESQYDIGIDFDALELESFRSVNSITDYLRALGV